MTMCVLRFVQRLVALGAGRVRLVTLTFWMLLAVLLLPNTAAAQFVTVDFQDSTPFTMTFQGGSRDLQTLGPHGPCANGVYWNFTRVAPGVGNGGFNNRGFARYTWCDYDVSRTSMGAAGWTEAGNHFRPAAGWPTDTFYGRFRIYIEQPIQVASGGDDSRQLKFFIWHAGVWDGDQRVIGFLDGGSNCGRSDNTHVCFSLQRNINHNTDSASVPIPIGQWAHLQFSWRHGPMGTSFVKVWLNNNTFGSPSAQDLNLSSSPLLPGGTAWPKDNAGYDGQFYIGNGANTGTRFASNFVLRLMDFELDTSFDSTFASGSTTTPTPAAPTAVRVIR
jgi:hypothetical protein